MFPESSAVSIPSRGEAPSPQVGIDVFIVHGHDNGAKNTVARFVETLKLKAIILDEQANEGRTIIEKFEQHSQADIGFAIVIITPDDVGASASEPANLQTRARQNVIFELGYFFGKLGRKRVVALYADDVELPSDISGVLHVSLDKGGVWKMHLAKEMKVAGLPVDLNDVV